MPRARTFYDVLEVGRQADSAEIKLAYRRLARELHPDRTLGEPEAIRTKKEKRFKEVSAAYTLLSDPASRAKYDQGLADARHSDMFGARFDDFVNRVSDRGVNRSNVNDVLDDFFAIAREFKKDSEVRASSVRREGERMMAEQEERQESFLGMIEDIFGIEVKVGGGKKR